MNLSLCKTLVFPRLSRKISRVNINLAKKLGKFDKERHTPRTFIHLS